VSMTSKVLAVAATLTVTGAASTLGTLPASSLGTLPASAATPECGPTCISIFSRELGTYAQPRFVEAVLGGVATVGQPVVLKAASSSDPSEDLMVHREGLVSDFFAAGMVSADVNNHFGNLGAAQIEYAPLGVGSDLCVGVATTAFQNEGLTLQPCSVPARTVWIVDTADSPGTALDGYFPLVNGSTTDFSRPFAMHYPRNAEATGDPTPQILVRRLQFRSNEQTVPDRQLWGTHFGVLPSEP
jgi:hypothetical protein